MEYEVADLAVAAGVSVDTLRYYQTGGLLPLPGRSGRKAVYTEEHLERLRLIRSMASKGLSLKAIRMLLDRRTDSGKGGDTALLAALEEETDGPAYSSEELARQLGVPEALVRSVEEAGLAEGQETEDGRRRYTEGDLAAARGAIRLLGFGIPLTKLLLLAVRHDRSIRKTCDGAIDLFDDYIRKRPAGSSDQDQGERVAKAFRELLPLVTAVVAHHFQRVLVNQALRRLKKKGDEQELSLALRVAAKTRLKVSWQ
jgi:DNA-binding transcriptional MerR regulator